MPKKQTSKKPVRKPVNNKQRSDLRAFWDKYWALIVGTAAIFLTVIAVLIFIAVSHVNNQNAINTQRKQFDAAEASLDALYAQIIKEVGQPTKVDKDKSCSYRSADLYQGERHCDIYIGIYFSNIHSPAEARVFSRQLESVVANNNNFSITNSNTNRSFADQSNNSYSGYTDMLETSIPMNCWIAYEMKPATGQANNAYSAGLSCSAVAKSEFYPVKN